MGDLKAKELLDAARHKGGIVMNGGEIREEATQEKEKITGEARHRTKSMIDDQKGRAAEGLGSIAEAIRKAGEKLREKDKGIVAQYAERAADNVQHFSSYLNEKSIDDVIRDSKDIARRRPLLVMGGAFIAGLALARFFKRSGETETSGFESDRPIEEEMYSTEESTTVGPCS